MGFSNTSGCFSVSTYERCEQHFNTTPRPRSQSKWNDNQRPLDNAAKWHYRLERHEDGSYYDVCLYHTVMARLHRPQGNTRRVEYRGDSRATSTQFMWRVLDKGVYNKGVVTDDTREVCAPISGYPINGSKFSLDMLLVDGRIELSDDLAHITEIFNAGDDENPVCALIGEELGLASDEAVCQIFWQAGATYFLCSSVVVVGCAMKCQCF